MGKKISPVLFVVALLCALFSIAVPNRARAEESSNCENTKTRADCLVHADQNLTSLAEQVDKAYKTRLASLDDDEKSALEYQQEHWLKMRVACVSPRVASLTSDQRAKAVACLSRNYQGRLTNISYRCELDEQHTVQEMAGWNEPWSNKVPSGFKIDQHLIEFVVTPTNLINIPIHFLPINRPSDPQKPTGLLRYGYRDVAQCRAQDPEGRWWLVIGGEKADLLYVPEDQTMTFTAYTEKSAEDNKKWREEHPKRPPQENAQ